MAERAVVPSSDGRGVGGFATSLGHELPARQEGFVSQNALYDRQNAERQSSRNEDDVVHEVRDPADLDVAPNEPVFIRKTHRTLRADPRMLVLSSLNGLPAVPAIEDAIIPVGIATTRIQFETDAEYEMVHDPIAVQMAGKVSLRSQVDIPVGNMVRLKAPSPREVTGYMHNPSRPPSKVTLEIEPVDNGESFAQRILNELRARNDPENDSSEIANQTPRDRALKAIEDGLLVSVMGWVHVFDQFGYMSYTIIDLLNPAGNAHYISRRRENLTYIISIKSDIGDIFPGQTATKINDVLDGHLRMFAAFSDLLRLEGNFVLGKCTRYNKRVADILM